MEEPGIKLASVPGLPLTCAEPRVVLNILPLPQILFAVHEEYESELQIVSVAAATPSDGIHG